MGFHDQHLDTQVLINRSVGTAQSAPKTVGGTIGDHARHALRLGLNNREALSYVKAVFPDGQTSLKCIAYYRKTLRNSGEDVPTSRQADKAREAQSGLAAVLFTGDPVHLLEPHEAVSKWSEASIKRIGVLKTAERLEAFGQSAFYLSDRVLEAH